MDEFKGVHERMQEQLNKRHKDLEDPDTITLKRIYSTHCQVCGWKYQLIELVYFVPIDNNIVCSDCAFIDGVEYEPRIYKEGE